MTAATAVSQPELLDLYGIGDILPALPQPIESHAIAGRVTREAAAA